MKLREISLAQDRKGKGPDPFARMTRHVSALFERCCAGKVETKHHWKILITVTGQDDERVLDYGREIGVVEARIKFDVDAYFALDKAARAEKALELLTEGASRAVRTLSWESAWIQSAAAWVRERGFDMRWQWKSKRNRRRTLLANANCQIDESAFTLTLSLADSAGTVISDAVIARTEPEEFIFTPMLGDLRWVGEDRVCVLDKQGNEVGTLSAPTHS